MSDSDVPNIGTVDRLLAQGAFAEAKEAFDRVPDGPAKDGYAEMFYRVWSYTEQIGLTTMGDGGN